MKIRKNKLIGSLIAFGGIVASFATAAALYTKAASPTGFGIGAEYQAIGGAIQYTIDGKVEGRIEPTYWISGTETNHGEALGGEHLEYNEIQFAFPVGATYDTTKQVAQPYVLGNFSVSITNVVPALQNHAHVWTEVKGWTSSFDGKWGSSDANKNFNASGDEAISGSSYSKSKNIVVETNHHQSVVVIVKLDNTVMTEATMLQLAETKPFDISVTWQGPQDYDLAYVVGNKTNWEVDDAYAMVPNLLSESGFEWSFTGLTGFSEAKCSKPAASAPDNWSADPNATLTPGSTYTVTWSGSGLAQAHFE
jgi:hypothetical protein